MSNEALVKRLRKLAPICRGQAEIYIEKAADEIERLEGLLVEAREKEWVGLTEDLLELSKDAWGRDKLHIGRSDHTGFYIDFGQLIEAKLKEKNNAS